MRKNRNRQQYAIVTMIALLFAINTYSQTKLQLSPDTTTSIVHEKINVAFATQRAIELVSAVNTVWSDMLEARSLQSTSSSLSGLLPGLTVRNLSSASGSNPLLFVRGRNTYNTDNSLGRPGNSPLLMVDGFKADINLLSIYEIESVTILKDANALAMYGMDGANGALLVTTKRGTVGKTKVRMVFNQGIQQPTQLPDYLNARNYAIMYNEALKNDGLDLKYDPVNDIPNYGKEGVHQYLHPDNDYWRDITKQYIGYNSLGINISGGTKIVKYMVTAGYLYNGGLFENTEKNSKYSTQSDEHRFNLRANLDAQITNEFTLRADVSGYLSNLRSNGVNNQISLFNSLPPQAFPLLNPDGTYGGTSVYPNNPLAQIESTGYQKTIDRNVNATFRLNYDLAKLVKGLSAGGAMNVNTNTQIVDAKTRNYATYQVLNYDENTQSYVYSPIQGLDTDLAWNGAPVTSDQRYSIQANLDYDVSWSKSNLKNQLLFRTEQAYVYDDYYTLRTMGLSLRSHYGYADKYFAEFTAGYYGGEQFTAENRFHFYPSGGVSWVLSNEDFMQDVNLIDFLKLRSSYGIVGGSSFATANDGNTAQLFNNRIYLYDRYSGAPYALFGNATTTANYAGTATSRMSNPFIGWEKSYKANIGIELIVLKSLHVNADVFHDRRTDIMSLVRYMPGIYGMNLGGRQPIENGGEVTNKGYEVTIDYSGKVGEFIYSIGTGIWHNKSTIVKRPDAVIYSNQQASIIGKPVNQNMGYVADGFFPVGTVVGQALNPKHTFGYVQEGDVKYKDMTGDDVVDENDQIALGFTDLPEYTYTLNLNLKYKGFYFSALGQGTLNSSAMMSGLMRPFSTNQNALNESVKRWTPETAATAIYPRLSTTLSANNNRNSTVWQRSTAYFKLRNLEFGYEFSPKQLQIIKISQLRLFVKGNDVLTVTDDLNFIDPESFSLGYPVMRMFNIGLTTVF
jgi:TonB-linked SusC/RagA family outer membrane protein